MHGRCVVRKQNHSNLWTNFSSAVLSCFLDSTALSFSTSSSEATPTAPPTCMSFRPSAILNVPPNWMGEERVWPPLDLDCDGSLRLLSMGVVGRSSVTSLGTSLESVLCSDPLQNNQCARRKILINYNDATSHESSILLPVQLMPYPGGYCLLRQTSIYMQRTYTHTHTHNTCVYLLGFSSGRVC